MQLISNKQAAKELHGKISGDVVLPITDKQAAMALHGKNSGDVVLPITDKQAAMALRDICTYNYEQSWEPYFSDRTTDICVVECMGEPVSAYSYELLDGDAMRVPAPLPIFYIEAGGLVFTIRGYKDGGYSPWTVQTPGYAMPADAEVRGALSQVLTDTFNPYFDPSCEECGKLQPDFYDEWTRKEMADDIRGKLRYERYLRIGPMVYPYDGDAEQFIAKRFAPEEVEIAMEESEPLTPAQAAAYLADKL